MDTKQVIKSQYLAALEMLKLAVEKCPDSLWNKTADKNRFWHIAYHALFYTHFYLHPSAEDYQPWDQHTDEFTSLGKDPEQAEGVGPYSKQEILDYVRYCQGQIGKLVDAIDLDGTSGFHWLPFNKLELQFYNIRHLQLHTGELCERLWSTNGIEIGWVGSKPTT
jgi:hypothetical protein